MADHPLPARGLGPLAALANQPYALLVLTMAFWSGNMVLARGIVGHVPPVALAQMRWTLALLILLPFTLHHVRRDWPTIRRHWRVMVLLGALGIAVYNTLVYVALTGTTAVNATLLASLLPLLIAAVGFALYRDRLSAAQLGGIVAASAGAVVILSAGDLASLVALAIAPGDLLILAAHLAYATYTVVLRARPDIHPLSFLTATIFLGQLMLVPATVGEALMGAEVSWDLTTVGSVVYVALFASVLAYLCFNRGVALVGSNRAGPFFHLVPVFGSLGAIVFLGERVELYHGLGWGLILGGIALAQVRPGRHR